MKKIALLIAVIAAIMAANGCGHSAPPIKPRPVHMPQPGQQITIDLRRAEEVKNLIGEVEEVEDSSAVVVDQDIAAAIKVSGFNRLRLESIRNRARDKIKQAYPGFHVYLTSDKKLFKQLQQLEKDLQKSNLSLTEARAKLNKVISDM
ncbi:MAG: sporulation protein [Syntrophomonadaceae bacterium]|nr:sporulation protein [Syntrophomonadaceae bacterium]